MNINEILTETAFQTWLAKQPDERKFDFLNGSPGEEPPCLMCGFLRDHGLKNFLVGGTTLTINEEDPSIEIEIVTLDWFPNTKIAEELGVDFTAKEVKALIKIL